MSKKMLIEAKHGEEIRVAIIGEKNHLLDFDFEYISKRPIKGNVYLGKIVRIEPSLQAAFVEYGGNRHGFLAFSEIHPDYFKIPVEDREALTKRITEDRATSLIEDLDLEDSNAQTSSSAHSKDIANETENETEEELFSSESHESLAKKYKIQEVIKSRQIVLVQALKEERGNKGAALTTYISLAGRYCVLMPNAENTGGISRKITDATKRKKLKQLIQDIGVPQGMALIVRTAGLDRSKTEIKRDFRFLLNLWTDIRAETVKSTAPALIYQEGNIINRALRDLYTKDIEEILVEGEDQYKEAKYFIKRMVPSHSKKVQKYKDDLLPLFSKYKVQEQIDEIFKNKVVLPSGGYLIIDTTEALTAIDINSGRSTRERHIDSTSVKTNLEAAEEIARQVRLRDIAGLIVIDFIDMSEFKHNHMVEKRLRESMQIDRARLQIGKISMFGLLEMSRQRLRPSIIETSTIPCPHCEGAGIIRSVDSLFLQLIRYIEEISIGGKETHLKVYISSAAAIYVLNQKRQQINNLEQKYSIYIEILPHKDTHDSTIIIENLDGKLLVNSQAEKKASSSKREGEKSRHKKPQKKNKGALKDTRAPAQETAVDSESNNTPQKEISEDKNTKKPSENKKNQNNRRRKRKPFPINKEISKEDAEGDKGKQHSRPTETQHTSPKKETQTASRDEKKMPSKVSTDFSKKDQNSTLESGKQEKNKEIPSHNRPSNPEKFLEPVQWDSYRKDKGTGSKSLKKGWWQRLLDS